MSFGLSLAFSSAEKLIYDIGGNICKIMITLGAFCCWLLPTKRRFHFLEPSVPISEEAVRSMKKNAALVGWDQMCPSFLNIVLPWAEQSLWRDGALQ